MVSFLRFIFGYVTIMVSGESPHEILNILLLNRVSFWSIRRETNSITFCLPVKDYKRIREIRKKTKFKAKIKIINKVGFIFIIRKITKRKSVVIGILIALLINVFMTNYIWMIDVNGANILNEDEIINVTSELGVYQGINKRKIDTYLVSQQIALKFKEIAWISLNIEGSKLTINISEASDSIKAEEQPSNLIASYDGVIKSIVSKSGTSVIKPGQTVRKGEVLISGIETIGERYRYVYAKGDVIAQTYRTFTQKIEKNYQVAESNNQISVRNVLEVFGLKIPLYLQGVKDFSSSYFENKSLKIFNQNMPIGITSRCFIMQNTKSINLNKDEAINIALSYFENKIRQCKINEISSYNVNVSESENHFIVTLNAVCIEDIGETYFIESPNY